MEPLKRNTSIHGQSKVSRLDSKHSCQHPDRRSFTMCCMKCILTLIMPTVEGLYWTQCECACVFAHEGTWIIIKILPISLWQTDSIHAWYQGSGSFAKWLNKPSNGCATMTQSRISTVDCSTKHKEGIHNSLLQQECQSHCWLVLYCS